MSPSAFTNTIELLAAVGLGVWLFYGPWQRLLVDTFRQSLFDVRDKVFLMAADKRIGFDDPLYGAFRGRINAMIRFADNFRWQTIVANIIATSFASRRTPHNRPDLTTMIKQSPDKVLAFELEALYVRAVLLCVLLIVSRSIMLMALTIVMLPFVLPGAIGRFDRVKGAATRPVSATIERELPAAMA